MRILLDTNTCIALMRRNERVRERMESLSPGHCAVSAITAMELYHGLERCAQPVREQEKIDELLSVVEVLPFDDSGARCAAKVRHALEQAGTVIGPFDLLIAAHALATGLVLVTHNTREFLRVAGLTVEDWQKPA